MTDNITTKNNAEPNTTTCYNVYFARGHGVLKKPGNIKYRELINEHALAYKNNIHPKGKNSVAQKVVSAIQALGGNFYHLKDSQSDLHVLQWETVCPKLLLKKVKQSLRDVKTSTPITYTTGKKSSQPAPISSNSWIPSVFDDDASTAPVNNNVHNDLKTSSSSSADAFNVDLLLADNTQPNNLTNSTSTTRVLNPFGKTNEYTIQSVNNTAHNNHSTNATLASTVFNADYSFGNTYPTTSNTVHNNPQPSTATPSPHNAIVFLDDPNIIRKSNDIENLDQNLRTSTSTIDFVENLFLDGASTSLNHSVLSATSFDSNIFETANNDHSECSYWESMGFEDTIDFFTSIEVL